MPQRRTNRRQFLSAQSAIEAIEDFADGVKSELSPPTSRSILPSPTPLPTYLLELSRDAMAVEFQVLLNAGEHLTAPESALAALDLVEKLESQLTVYRETSEVSRLNQMAYDAAIGVERRLYQLLQQAVQFSVDTGGAYDLTSGPLSKVWGFYRRQGRLPSLQEISEVMQRTGYRHLKFNDELQTIQFLERGMEINLGGIGKGYALDRMSEQLQFDGIADFLLHGGQSSVLARGTRRGIAGGAGWLVAIVHPLRSGERLAEFRLHNQALGTSGAGTQFFHHQGKRYGHILDPRSGWPAQGILSSTVIAPTAAAADALSTAFYVGGLDLARRYCESRPSIAAILIVAGSQAGSLQIETLNMSDQQWQLMNG